MAGWSTGCVWRDIGQEPPRRLRLRAWGNSIIMIGALTVPNVHQNLLSS